MAQPELLVRHGARLVQFHTYGILEGVQRTHWWFVSRRRILEAMLRAARPGRTDLKILEVGCGTGVNLELLRHFGSVTGLDNSDEALRRCRALGFRDVTKGDVLALPFRDKTFDLVVAMDVVEHLDDDVGVLREIRRILKPGGMAYITVPAFMFLWSLQDDVSLHKRRYTRTQLAAAVAASGLSISRITYMNFFMFPVILALRWLMKALRIQVDSENRINPSITNGPITAVFSAEAKLLPRMNFPFGVSVLCLAERPVGDAPRATRKRR